MIHPYLNANLLTDKTCYFQVMEIIQTTDVYDLLDSNDAYYDILETLIIPHKTEMTNLWDEFIAASKDLISEKDVIAFEEWENKIVEEEALEIYFFQAVEGYRQLKSILKKPSEQGLQDFIQALIS